MSEHVVRANHEHSAFIRREAAETHWCMLIHELPELWLQTRTVHQ